LPDLIVQMGCFRTARISHKTDQVAPFDVLSPGHIVFAHMGVQGHIAITVVDPDMLAVTRGAVVRPGDLAVPGRIDRRSPWGREIHAPVHFSKFGEGVGTPSVARGHAGDILVAHRLYGR